MVHTLALLFKPPLLSAGRGIGLPTKSLAGTMRAGDATGNFVRRQERPEGRLLAFIAGGSAV
jgi:hypothetical protein